MNIFQIKDKIKPQRKKSNKMEAIYMRVQNNSHKDAH